MHFEAGHGAPFCQTCWVWSALYGATLLHDV